MAFDTSGAHALHLHQQGSGAIIDANALEHSKSSLLMMLRDA
jgi:hypothetical protein